MTIAELYAAEPAWLIGSVFLLSLLIGSFLNVVIHRLPIMMDRDWRQQAEAILAPQGADVTPTTPPEKYNLVVPRSACPSCGTQITALQNVPVISWLVLRGKCANCAAPISRRYPLIELATALFSAVVAWRLGFTPHMAAALIMTWMLIAMSMIDIDHQLLPDDMTLPLIWIGLFLSIFQGQVLNVTPQDAILGAIAGYLSLWLVNQAYKIVRKEDGMGYGDFKLLAAFGAWLGWQQLLVIILLSSCVGSLVGIGSIVFFGRNHKIPIPYGPYLAAAGWIAMLWGDQIVATYLHSLHT